MIRARPRHPRSINTYTDLKTALVDVDHGSSWSIPCAGR